MNKIEIKKGLYRQNVYNILDSNGHYKSYTCYYDDNKNILMVFNASKAHNLISMIPDDSLEHLELNNETLTIIQQVLLSWAYDHLESVDLYNPDSMWNTSCKGIFKITERDTFVIENIFTLK